MKSNHIFIAHRGESFEAPENTLAAINLAWQREIRAVEIDVHLTADDEICVMHDKDTLRTTGKKLIIRKSVMHELQKLDAGSWKGEKWAGEKIPALTDVLATVPSDGKLIVEIKSDSAMLGKLKGYIENSGLQDDQIEIIAFNLQTLSKAKKMMPQIKMLWLFRSRPLLLKYLKGIYTGAVLRKIIKYNIDGVNIGDSRFLTREYIEKISSAGYPVYVWTVNDPNRALELFGYGVDCITSDRAARMAEKLKDKI
ncbi:MAG: glycerophosphodiester phosphodiesterase family protein [Bacteroidales bacterium]